MKFRFINQDEPKEPKQENLFAQASSSTSAAEPGIGSFVFGSKMEDRVVVSFSLMFLKLSKS